jgi:hypothetical protein
LNRKRKEKPDANGKTIQQKKRSLSSKPITSVQLSQQGDGELQLEVKRATPTTAVARPPSKPSNAMMRSPMTRASLHKLQEEQGPSDQDLAESAARSVEKEKQTKDAIDALETREQDVKTINNSLTMLKWEFLKVSFFICALFTCSVGKICHVSFSHSRWVRIQTTSWMRCIGTSVRQLQTNGRTGPRCVHQLANHQRGR